METFVFKVKREPTYMVFLFLVTLVIFRVVAAWLVVAVDGASSELLRVATVNSANNFFLVMIKTPFL